MQEAEDIAKKGKMDGVALYEQSEEEFVNMFGREGRIVFKELQRSKRGCVSLSFISF